MRRFQLNGRDRAVGIFRQDRPDDKLLLAAEHSQQRRDSPFVPAELQRQRLPLATPLMDRLQSLLHSSRPAFIRRRRGQHANKVKVAQKLTNPWGKPRGVSFASTASSV